VTPAGAGPKPTPRLVIASHNRAKAAEVAEVLRSEGIGIEVIGLADLSEVALPPETGSTFSENALAKAQHAARATGLPAVADDSGLEVDALGGEPGIMSARYAGEAATDEERYGRVLELLRSVPRRNRGARFRCAAAYVHPDGDPLLAEGICDGRIASSPAGRGGFGYDPIFVPQGETRTMAQLTPAEKHAISHRGRAFRDLARQMRARPGGCAR
jgi:XTP/dITP diphosphohydrolase